MTKKTNQVDKIINFSEVSKFLTGSNAIRSNQCPTMYREAVNELRLVIQYWVEKNLTGKNTKEL